MDKMIKRGLSSLIIFLYVAIFYLFIICSPAVGQEHSHDHGEHDHSQSVDSEDKTDSEHKEVNSVKTEQEHKHIHIETETETTNSQENLFASVIVEEKLGEKIPLDLMFVDEKKEPVKLSDLVDRPVLLQLVFYHCPQSCNFMMSSLASILKSITFDLGKDYRILTVSFDHEDTPTIASETKSNYIHSLPNNIPVDEWKYLTGNLPEINALTAATGFKFKQIGQHNFVHPNVLIVLSESGTVIRYLYGTEYLPFDVSMAITEAAKGTPSISIKKILSYCFDYDPKGKKYVFKTLQVSGAVLLILLGLFFFFVLKKGNKK